MSSCSLFRSRGAGGGIQAQRKGPPAATSNARWSVQNWLLHRTDSLSTSPTPVSSPFTAAGGAEAREGGCLVNLCDP